MSGTDIEITAITTHDEIVRAMDVRRRLRVRRDDRTRRIGELVFAAFNCIPLVWMWFNGDNRSEPGTLETAMMFWAAFSVLLVPVFVIRAALPQGETWGSRRRLPTFVPPPARLGDGRFGPVWSPDREDVIFERTRLVMKAVNARDADSIRLHTRNLMARAIELCGPYIVIPSDRSQYHYWPNTKTESGSGDERIVTYEDNHPIQHQRSRLEDVLEDLEEAMEAVADGVDVTDVDTSVRDLIAVLRRVIELEGFDASMMRPAKDPVIRPALLAEKEPGVGAIADHRGPGLDVVEYLRRTLKSDPDLVDEQGGRIETLLTVHVPRLLKAYEQAMLNATGSERAEIEAGLVEGLALIREATEKALAVRRRQTRDAFGTEIAFLRTRLEGQSVMEI